MRLCIIIKLHNDSSLQRVSEDAPGIISKIQSFSKEPVELIFRSNDGLLFGRFMVTDKPTGIIQAEVIACTGFQNDDAMILFEVGDGPRHRRI